MTFKNLLTGIMLCAGVMGMAASASADTLRIASGVPPKHPGHNPLYTEFQTLLPKVSEGRLNATILGPEIVKLSSMRDGIKSGLVDVGLFLTSYFPADLPEANLVGDLSFLGKNPQAMGAAMTEYIATCAECQAELKKLGIVFASTHSTNPYNVLSKAPIKSLDDIKGKRLRVGGPQFSRWVEALGGTPVSTPVGETFQSLSQGVIDGTVASAADIVSFRLNEVVGNVTAIKLGTYHSVLSHAVRLDKWKSMSPADRKAIVVTSSRTSALTAQRWTDIANKGLKIAKDSGLKIVEPDQSLLDATAKFVSDDLKQVANTAQERDKIANAAAKIERFRQLVSKWEKIAADNNNDPVKLGDAMEKEIWSAIDFNTYGL